MILGAVYKHFRENIRTYSKTDPEILTLFIRLTENLGSEYKLDDDTLHINGTESIIPGCLDKTIRALQYCSQNYDYDFIVRTNLSSLWNLSLLKVYLRKCPKQQFISSRLEFYYHENFTYPSGSSIIMSKDITKFVIDNRNNFDFSLTNDISFGKFFTKYQIQMRFARRYDFIEKENKIDIPEEKLNEIFRQQHYHYRFRSQIDQYRMNDIEIFKKICNKIYRQSVVYKYIMLVVEKDISMCEKIADEIRKYSKLDEDFLVLFVYPGENTMLLDDVLYIHSCNSILERTFKAMEYCLCKYTCQTFIITDLSSFWYLPTLKRECEQTQFENIILSDTIMTQYNIQFPDFSGYLMATDTARTIVANIKTFSFGEDENTNFGIFLLKKGISIQPGDKYNLTEYNNNSELLSVILRYTVKQNYYHYHIEKKEDWNDNNIDKVALIFQKMNNETYNNISHNDAIPACTLVTAFYNITRYNTILPELKNKCECLLKTPCYMIIYGDDTTIPVLKKIRNSYGFKYITYYITKPFDKLWTYQFIE